MWFFGYLETYFLLQIDFCINKFSDCFLKMNYVFSIYTQLRIYWFIIFSPLDLRLNPVQKTLQIVLNHNLAVFDTLLKILCPSIYTLRNTYLSSRPVEMFRASKLYGFLCYLSFLIVVTTNKKTRKMSVFFRMTFRFSYSSRTYDVFQIRLAQFPQLGIHKVQ